MEMRWYRRLLHIPYKDHITNEKVCNKIQAAIGPYENILTTVKKRKLRWFGHVITSSGLCKKIVHWKLVSIVTVILLDYKYIIFDKKSEAMV